ncbi:MAG TPA: hypothetical protein VGG83_12435 [Trebonia sp.]
MRAPPMVRGTAGTTSGPCPREPVGLRTFEIIRRDDGSEDGAWLSSTVQGHEVVWTSAEYAAKPGWGARLPSTFRTYGTPPAGVPEESVTSDWPAPPSHTP